MIIKMSIRFLWGKSDKIPEKEENQNIFVVFDRKREESVNVLSDRK